MKLVFLGTSGAAATAEDANVGFAVSLEERSLLVEASGSPVGDLERAGLDIRQLEAVVVSHAHPDHLYAFPVLHSRPTSGVRLAGPGGCLVYSADTAPCPRIAEEARGCATLIHESSCTADQEPDKNLEGHSPGRQAGRAASVAGVKALFLCHFDYRAGAIPRLMQTEARTAFGGTVRIPQPYQPYLL